MNDIQNITVDREGLVSSPQGAVLGITKVEFYKVGDLYITTTKKRWGFSVSVEPFGNSVCVQADTPRGAAQKVALDYESYLSRCKRTALPIPDWYIAKYGTGME